MQKHIYSIILSTISATVLADANWEVGVALGGGAGSDKENLQITDGTAYSLYKFNVRGSGPVAGLRVGYNRQYNNTMIGAAFGTYNDFYTMRNDGPKTDLRNGLNFDSRNDIKRKYTFEFVGTVGHAISKDVMVYGRAGLLYSQFKDHYIDFGSDLSKTSRGKGGVLGIGIKKNYKFANVGLEYNYQCYEKLATTAFFKAGRINLTKETTVRPKYHNVMLTFSKII